MYKRDLRNAYPPQGMNRRDFLRMTGAGLAGAALLGVAGCGGDEGQIKNASLTIAGPAGQVEYLEKWTKKWEEETGGKVTINAIPFTEIDDKYLTATGTGTFIADIYYIGTGTAGQLMAGGDVLEMPSDLESRLGLDEVAPIFRDYQLSWAGKKYGVPYDGDILNLYYRSDLLEDQKNQQAFRSEYGYDLTVPDTWEEYGNIAQFLDRDWDGDGQPNYGLVELPMRNNHAWNGFFSRAAAYAKHPDDPGFFFDTDTMEPRIANAGFVRALEDWKEAMQWGPPDMLNYGWSENAQAFIGGRAAQDIQWGDIGPMSLDEEQSVVKGKVGYAINPGTDEVWNPKSGQWDSFGEPNRAPFAGFGGWIFVVPKLTENPDAAWDLATYLGRPEVRNDAVITPGTGVNPNSFDQLNDIDLWAKAGFSEEEAKDYTGAIIDSLKHPNAVLDLRIPGFPEYKENLELAVSKALSGQAPPDEALGQAAEEWASITERLNPDQQGQYYRESLGL